MDPSELPPGEPPPPKRELQGPRPTPLNVQKGSHKIKKPPMAPQPHVRQQTQQPPEPQPQPQPQNRRPPVIIYAVSPKVIHVHPSEFRSTVQRLTGAGASSSSTAPARVPPSSGVRAVHAAERIGTTLVEGSGTPSMPDRTGATSGGIVSPAPSSLPTLSPSMFPSVHDMSPAMQDINRSTSDSSLLSGPISNLVPNPSLSSPGAYWELFNQNPDL